MGDFVVLSWETAVGTVGLAYSITDAGGGVRRVGNDLHGTQWDHMHKVYDCLVAVGSGLNLGRAPQLEAIDVLADGRFSQVYEVTWQQLAAVLGSKAPWFHRCLRDPAAILEWRPGYPPALVTADDPELPTAPLALLALDEPDGSPAATVCTYLARRLRRRAAEHAAAAIALLTADEYGPEEDRTYVGIGALPAQLARHEEPEEPREPEQMVKLAGWAQITERRDTLADAVAGTVLRWDGGRDWPHGKSIELYPDRCPIAAEWVETLDPAPGDLPPTVAERRLLSGRRDHEDPLLLHDLATAAPAVGHTDQRGELTVTATCPRRIPSLAPLAEVILSHGAVWIRTDDGRLWLAPDISGVSLSRGDGDGDGGNGVGGNGAGGNGADNAGDRDDESTGSEGEAGGSTCDPTAVLVSLLDKLLDDITAPASALRTRLTPPQGLRALIEAAPRQATTRFDRAQLLAARAR
ncbi:MAG TPA: hypothetical protein VH372_05005 [Actinospica sp.]|nr:hypothetical protein [Actinospica sp.]